MAWSNGIAEWIEGDTAFISVAFSWHVQKAYQRYIWLRQEGYKVRVGGPGVFVHTLRKYFDGVENEGWDKPLERNINALVHHNPDATMASRGCLVGCYFCIVPKMEGREFTLLPDFIPRPVLCDNNLSALPVKYQEYIIKKYQKLGVPLLDANSGFEPRTFDEGTYRRWKVINKGAWRFGYDETSEGDDVYKMTRTLKDVPAGLKRVYVLIGNEPFEACQRRIQRVIEWGCEPFAQPMIALNALQKKPIIRYDWTEQKLRDLARWTNRWIWRTVPFKEYNRSYKVAKEVI